MKITDVGMQRFNRLDESSQSNLSTDQVARIVAEEAVTHASPNDVRGAVKGVAVEAGHVVVYAPDAFITQERDGATYLPFDKDLADQFRALAKLTSNDIFVSRKQPTPTAAALLADVANELKSAE